MSGAFGDAAFGWQAIATERNRQLDIEGFDAQHDANMQRGELLDAAMCYAAYAALQVHHGDDFYTPTIPPDWPWDEADWKPDDDVMRNLAKAGALIAAEIDRLHRASA